MQANFVCSLILRASTQVIAFCANENKHNYLPIAQSIQDFQTKADS